MIELSAQALIVVLLAICGMIAGFGKVLLTQFQKALDERAEGQRDMLESIKSSIRTDLDSHLRLVDARMKGFEDGLRNETARISNIDAEFRALNNSLAMRFVQREDFIRFATSIDHKIDRLGELFTRFTMLRPIDHE